eukprot:226295_1
MTFQSFLCIEMVHNGTKDKISICELNQKKPSIPITTKHTTAVIITGMKMIKNKQHDVRDTLLITLGKSNNPINQLCKGTLFNVSLGQYVSCCNISFLNI